MLPSASPLTTSWPIESSVSGFLDRPDQLGRLALVAVDAERVGEIAGSVGLIADQQALPILGGGNRIADRRLVAADLLDNQFQHVDGVVIRDREIVRGHLVL